MVIAVVIPAGGPRLWQRRLIERLTAEGHTICLRAGRESGMVTLDAILRLESLRGGGRLASPGKASQARTLTGNPELTVDLVGGSALSDTPTFSLLFDGHVSLTAAARTIAGGGLPTLTLMLDDAAVGRALPMVDDRIWLAKGLDDVLARAITLVADGVRRFAVGELGPRGQRPAMASSPKGLGLAYALGIGPRLVARRWFKTLYKPFHWRVGYRFVAGEGVAETATLDGTPWQELPEDGSRFYADPFPVEHDGRHFLFVEEFPHETGKGIISVAEAGADGVFGTPRPVLNEPFHLSYPQVFEADDAFWMLPETLGAGQLILYRAERFPERWVRDTTLIEDCALSDATLLHHGGRFWLFASDRQGGGSPSDCLVVFHAETLRGPWQAHRNNPILIDRTSSRPGGAFIRRDGRLFLPMQNGTLGYGGGLGLVEVLECNIGTVRLGPIRSIAASGWPYPRIHTLNRAGRLEAIDGFVRSRR